MLKRDRLAELRGEPEPVPLHPHGSPKNYTRPEIAEAMPRYWVYFIAARKSLLVKIGYAADPWKRLSNMNTGSPEKLVMYGLIETYLPVTLERELHERFAADRADGEWFRWSEAMDEYVTKYAFEWAEDLLAET